MSDQATDSGALLHKAASAAHPLAVVSEYWIDAFQRSVLFLDVLRQRGNISKAHNARVAPNVLHYEPELVIDGRTLHRPVNYALVRIVPPADVRIDTGKRPFIVVDPRAGHGPGIGGMKHDSEIGVAMQAGHPCYFVGFLPDPMPGQTIEDVCQAEALFVQAVTERHPDAEGKPVLIGNCQAGWQLMMMAAVNPDLCGPIMLAGSPLSYWAGVRGKNPLRYLGGMLGGTWLTALAGDLGNGIFDGADLVRNFESMNPANTLWGKSYNVYSKVDTEAARFLEFETWWGSPVLLNAGEMQWIADNLFVGNKLTAGTLHTSDGTRIDLRNINSPIVVFCSWGDDITPPQQALGWITDLYDEDREIIANGQTIVYTMHQSIGHLGIFVSAKVATREHQEFASAMDMIDLAPPGLYEAVITDIGEDTANPQLIEGRYLFRLEKRTLADIRALGNNDAEDQLRFATAARVSEANLALYRTTLGPLVRAMTTQKTAEAARAMHPARLKFGLYSDDNPAMRPVKTLAETIRQNRKPVSAANPLLAMERMASDWITTSLTAAAATRDMLEEQVFLSTYGSPWLQALMGFGPGSEKTLQRADHDLLREANEARLLVELDAKFGAGGLPEAVVRALIYVRLPDRSIDERGYTVAKALHDARPAGIRLSLPEVKVLFRDQYLLLLVDAARAVAALPGLLPADPAMRKAALSDISAVLTASGPLAEEGGRRLAEITAIFVPTAVQKSTEPASPSDAAAMPAPEPVSAPATVPELAALAMGQEPTPDPSQVPVSSTATAPSQAAVHSQTKIPERATQAASPMQPAPPAHAAIPAPAQAARVKSAPRKASAPAPAGSRAPAADGSTASPKAAKDA